MNPVLGISMNENMTMKIDDVITVIAIDWRREGFHLLKDPEIPRNLLRRMTKMKRRSNPK
jgi:hypothetical protein